MSLFVSPAFRASDANGVLPGATWTFYTTGTTTPATVYTTSALNVAHTNPVVADAAGLFPQIYLDPAVTYRAVLKNAAGTTEADIDPIDNASAATLQFTQAGSGTTGRTVQSKLEDLVSVSDYTSHAVADADGKTLYVPANVTSTRATGAAVVSPQWGPGRVTTADGNKRGKWFTNVTAAPSSLGTHDSVDTAFNGDLSKSIFQVEHRISGTATLSQPTSGYVYTPEASAFYGVLYNTSGYNNSTSTNSGRTGATFFRVNLQQYGQGDAAAYNATAIVSGAKTGATSFLANPAACLFNGDMTAGHAGVYLNPRELALDDGGFDVACVGDVMNLNRSINTAALGCWWGGYRVQVTGTKAIDNILSATGKANAGIDFSMSTLDFGTNKCAIGLKAGDRIYFDNASSNGNFADTFNAKYVQYNSSISAIEFVYGATILQIATDRVTLAKPPVLPTVVSSALPAAATANKGMEYYVSDANSTTRLSTVVGGGTNFVKVFSTGSAWVIQ